MGTFQINGKLSVDDEIFAAKSLQMGSTSVTDGPAIKFPSNKRNYIWMGYANDNGSWYIWDSHNSKGIIASDINGNNTFYGNADTATKLKTARNFTIGSTAKSFNGTAAVSWTHAEIGATVSNTWTNGTSSGPTLTTTVNSVASTEKAIPVASSAQSGVVTTGGQTFAGTKTFNGAVTFKSTFNIWHDGSRYGYIYFKNDAGTTVGYIRSDAGNATNITQHQWRFASASANATNDTGVTGYYDIFYLPASTDGRTANASYEIFTSKSYDTLDDRYVNVSGDTMTGSLTVGSSKTGVTIGTSGSFTCKVQTDGGWARGMSMYHYLTDGTETGIGAIGFYGSGKTCNFLYLGGDYSSPWAKVTPAGYLTASRVYGAVWNDYAEYRICNEDFKPGQVVCENNDDTLSIAKERLQPGANIVSDTFGFAIGETNEAKCPIAISGRVLAYTYEPRKEFQAGDAVCAAPNGTVSRMTREEIIQYPERIIGTVSSVPSYDTWGTGNVKVDNRIWIKVK